MWRVKSSNINKIIKAGGGNDYDQHRTAEEKEEQAKEEEAEKAKKR